MGRQAGIGWCFRLTPRLTEIFRPCDFEFFNRIGRTETFANVHVSRSTTAPRRVEVRPFGKPTAAYAGGRVCGNNADLLQRFAALLCKTDARALDKSLIELLAKNTQLDGVQGVECSNHFAPTNRAIGYRPRLPARQA